MARNSHKSHGFCGFSGLQHNYAMKSDGSLLGWGNNYGGQLGGCTVSTHEEAGFAGRTRLIINLDGNNFFKLRDVMRELDIGVTRDGATSTIGIDTNELYTD